MAYKRAVGCFTICHAAVFCFIYYWQKRFTYLFNNPKWLIVITSAVLTHTAQEKNGAHFHLAHLHDKPKKIDKLRFFQKFTIF
jgi:hypothetical protein